MRTIWTTGLLTIVACLLWRGALAQAQDDPNKRGDEVERLDIRGMTFVPRGRRGGDESEAQLDKLHELGFNWITICEYAYIDGVDSTDIRFRSGGGEGGQGWLHKQVENAHERGMKVMLKPQLWSREFHDGDWHGSIAMKSEQDWAAFFESYTAFVVDQAKIAQNLGVDGLCVGVEMKGTSAREADWRKLIAAVRDVYDGPITYSANSDEWQNLTWWDAVDVIGITAYFPLSQDDYAGDAEIRAGWQKVYAELDAFQKKSGMAVVFTELGYSRSVDAAREPWRHDEREPDDAFQARLYRIALEEAQKREYVAGVFVWKWFSAELGDRPSREAFLVQNRPQTLDVFAEAFGGAVASGDEAAGRVQ